MAEQLYSSVPDPDEEYLKKVLSGTAQTNPVPPPAFVPDYMTAESTAKSMMANPQIGFEEKLPSMDYLQTIKQKQTEIGELKKQKETKDLDNLANNYNLYKSKAEEMGLPVPPQPKRLKEYLSTKEKENVAASQAVVEERNAADRNVGSADPTKKVAIEGQVLNEPYLNALSPGYNQQKSSLQQQANIATQKANETASYYEQLDKNLADVEAKRLERENEAKTTLDNQMKIIDVAKDDLRKSDMDPNRVWKRMSAGNEILMGISLALGAAGQAMSRTGNNQALDVLNRIIDRDIDAQKEEISKKKGLVDAESNVYQIMRQKFGDDRLADSATRQYYIEAQKLKLDQVAAKYGGKEATAKIGQLQGALSVEQQKEAMQFAKLSAEISDTKAKSANLNADKYVPGLKQYALTADDAKELKKADSDRNSVKQGINRLKEIRTKYGSELSNRAVVAEAKTIATDMLLKYKNIAQLGVLSKSDQDLLDKLMPADPTQFEWTGSTMAQLGAFEKLVDSGFQNLSLSKGLNPGAASSEEVKVIGGKTYKKVGDNQWQEQVTE